MKKQIKRLFKDAKRIDPKINYSNTNPVVKDLNRAINSGAVKINIQKKGEIWTNERIDNGKFRFNLEVFSAGYVQRFYAWNLTPVKLLNCVSALLKQPKVKAEIIKTVNSEEICSKCAGRGRLNRLAYQKEAGVCFECMGTGVGFIKATGLKLV